MMEDACGSSVSVENDMEDKSASVCERLLDFLNTLQEPYRINLCREGLENFSLFAETVKIISGIQLEMGDESAVFPHLIQNLNSAECCGLEHHPAMLPDGSFAEGLNLDFLREFCSHTRDHRKHRQIDAVRGLLESNRNLEFSRTMILRILLECDQSRHFFKKNTPPFQITNLLGILLKKERVIRLTREISTGKRGPATRYYTWK